MSPYHDGRWENDNGRLAVTGYGGPQSANTGGFSRRSHEKIARVWAGQYEGLHRKATPGSKYFGTYVSISDVEEDYEAAQEEAVTDAAFKERARSGGAPGAFFSNLSKIDHA